VEDRLWVAEGEAVLVDPLQALADAAAREGGLRVAVGHVICVKQIGFAVWCF